MYERLAVEEQYMPPVQRNMDKDKGIEPLREADTEWATIQVRQVCRGVYLCD